ncbi:MAG: hypothetical protein ACP5O3_02485 [Candidatus Micrarchaeia archaeon]
MDSSQGKPKILEVRRPPQLPQPTQLPEPPAPPQQLLPQPQQPQNAEPPALVPPQPTASREENPLVAQMRAEAMRDMGRTPQQQPAPRSLEAPAAPQPPKESTSLTQEELRARIESDQAKRKKSFFSFLSSLFKKKPKQERGLLEA